MKINNSVNNIVTNAQVYELAESIYASGYPMMTQIPIEDNWQCFVSIINGCIERNCLDNPHLKRAIALANSKGGGHDQFLSGILVSFDLTLENKLWVETERYRFLTFVSSQSTMHRGAKLSIEDCCNSYVDESIVKRLTELQNDYNANPTPEKYLTLLMNLPSGFKLTARITTNYRCLKNIYWQRKSHRLPMWHDICDWIENLPLAEQLIVGEKKEKEE